MKMESESLTSQGMQLLASHGLPRTVVLRDRVNHLIHVSLREGVDEEDILESIRVAHHSPTCTIPGKRTELQLAYADLWMEIREHELAAVELEGGEQS